MLYRVILHKCSTPCVLRVLDVDANSGAHARRQAIRKTYGDNVSFLLREDWTTDEDTPGFVLGTIYQHKTDEHGGAKESCVLVPHIEIMTLYHADGDD